MDSGSSHNFISEALVVKLTPWTALPHSMAVKVADGAMLQCTHEVVNCSWSVNGELFNTTFKILPLQCYDAILGMEWLESFSPIQIEWKQKWLSFDYQGKNVKLQGIQDAPSAIQEVTVHQLSAMERTHQLYGMVEVYAVESDIQHSDSSLPPEISALVDQFQDIFAEPTRTPPARSHTHTIPLVPGVQPFRLKPYRYTPFQKMR